MNFLSWRRPLCFWASSKGGTPQLAEWFDAGSTVNQERLETRPARSKPRKVSRHTKRLKNTRETFHAIVKFKMEFENKEHRLEKIPGFAATLHCRMRKVV
jgi:hypothetical protein